MYYNEGIPNCVPEYYRDLEEKADRGVEKQSRDVEHYKANREKRQAALNAGLPLLDYGGYGSCCFNCRRADHDTQVNVNDDFDTVICHDPNCPEHKKAEQASKSRSC